MTTASDSAPTARCEHRRAWLGLGLTEASLHVNPQPLWLHSTPPRRRRPRCRWRRARPSTWLRFRRGKTRCLFNSTPTLTSVGKSFILNATTLAFEGHPAAFCVPTPNPRLFIKTAFRALSMLFATVNECFCFFRLEVGGRRRYGDVAVRGHFGGEHGVDRRLRDLRRCHGLRVRQHDAHLVCRQVLGEHVHHLPRRQHVYLVRQLLLQQRVDLPGHTDPRRHPERRRMYVIYNSPLLLW